MGNSESLLTEEKIEELTSKTHFNQKEIKELVKRYSDQINPEVSTEMTKDNFLSIPEMACTPFAGLIFHIYTDKDKTTMNPEEFLSLYSVLSRKGTMEEKQKLMFQILDIQKEGELGFEELFRFYKAMYTTGFTDEQLTAMTNSILKVQNVKEPGRINFEEFCKMISLEDLNEKLTIELQIQA